jgi:hypothetical protein
MEDSAPLEHDPEKWKPVFPRDSPEIMLKQKDNDRV